MRTHSCRSRACLADVIAASLSRPRQAPRAARMLLDCTAAFGITYGCIGSAAAYTVDTALDPGPVGTTSLRQAVLLAHAFPNSVVQFAPALNGNTIILQGGEIVVNQSMSINGPGADKLTISGNNASRLFFSKALSGTIAVTISGLKLTEGHASTVGGAIRVEETQLTLRHAIVSGNNADSGGGITCGSSSSCTFSDVTIAGNHALGVGGGILAAFAPLQIEDSVISGNTADKGAGIYAVERDVDVTLTRIVGNQAAHSGGGIFSYSYSSHSLDVDRSTISGNSAGNNPNSYGGGIGFNSPGQLNITRSLISGNNAYSQYNDGGGGIATLGSIGSLYLVYSTVQGNYAVGAAGGILSHGLKMYASGATIAGNATGNYDAGNGIKVFGTANFLRGCIVANNFNRDGNDDLAGQFQVVSYSLVKDPGSAFFFVGGSNNIFDGTDPQLGPLAVNGGPTLSMLPAAASAVINTSTTDILGATDQRGVPRVFGVRADMGAVERQNPEVMIFRDGFDSS